MIIRFKFFLILFYFTSCNYENNIIEHYSKNKDRLDYLIEIINNKNHINFINLRNFTDSYLDLVFPNITTFKIASFSGEKIFEIKSDKEFEMLNYLDSVLNQKYLINKRSPITEGDSMEIDSIINYYNLSKFEIIEIYKIMFDLKIIMIEFYENYRNSFMFYFDNGNSIVFSENIDSLNISKKKHFQEFRENWYINSE